MSRKIAEKQRSKSLYHGVIFNDHVLVFKFSLSTDCYSIEKPLSHFRLIIC